MAGETTLEAWRERLLAEQESLRHRNRGDDESIKIVYATLQGIVELHFEQHKGLVDFGRKLAACDWASSPSYESTTHDDIHSAVEDAKAAIGNSLLELLGEK